MTKDDLIRRNAHWARSILMAARYASAQGDTEAYDDMVEIAAELVLAVEKLTGGKSE